MPLSLRELRQWVPEIADLARATHDMAANHANSTAFYRDVVKATTWQGQAVVMSNDPRSPNFAPAPYGGYILPGSTLSNLGLFGSQWYQPPGGPVQYHVTDIQANVLPRP